MGDPEVMGLIPGQTPESYLRNMIISNQFSISAVLKALICAICTSFCMTYILKIPCSVMAIISFSLSPYLCWVGPDVKLNRVVCLLLAIHRVGRQHNG